MGEEKTEEKNLFEKLIEETEKEIKEICEDGISVDNIKFLSEMVDIHKDLKNEKYWEEKIDFMKYRNYGNYGSNFDNYRDGSYGRRYRDGGYGNYGNYGNYGEYGARGYDTKYRGEQALDNAYQAYREYSDSGNYGADNMEKIEMMTDSLMDFVEHIKKIAKTPEEKQFIEKKVQELSQM